MKPTSSTSVFMDETSCDPSGPHASSNSTSPRINQEEFGGAHWEMTIYSSTSGQANIKSADLWRCTRTHSLQTWIHTTNTEPSSWKLKESVSTWQISISSATVLWQFWCHTELCPNVLQQLLSPVSSFIIQPLTTITPVSWCQNPTRACCMR